MSTDQTSKPSWGLLTFVGLVLVCDVSHSQDEVGCAATFSDVYTKSVRSSGFLNWGLNHIVPSRRAAQRAREASASRIRSRIHALTDSDGRIILRGFEAHKTAFKIIDEVLTHFSDRRDLLEAAAELYGHNGSHLFWEGKHELLRARFLEAGIDDIVLAAKARKANLENEAREEAARQRERKAVADEAKAVLRGYLPKHKLDSETLETMALVKARKLVQESDINETEWGSKVIPQGNVQAFMAGEILSRVEILDPEALSPFERKLAQAYRNTIQQLRSQNVAIVGAHSLAPSENMRLKRVMINLGYSKTDVEQMALPKDTRENSTRDLFKFVVLGNPAMTPPRVSEISELAIRVLYPQRVARMTPDELLPYPDLYRNWRSFYEEKGTHNEPRFILVSPNGEMSLALDSDLEAFHVDSPEASPTPYRYSFNERSHRFEEEKAESCFACHSRIPRIDPNGGRSNRIFLDSSARLVGLELDLKAMEAKLVSQERVLKLAREYRRLFEEKRHLDPHVLWGGATSRNYQGRSAIENEARNNSTLAEYVRLVQQEDKIKHGEAWRGKLESAFQRIEQAFGTYD